MILACPGCDSRYDVTGHPVGRRFRCRCGTVLTLEAPSPTAGMLSCPWCAAGVAPGAKTCAHCNHELLLKACPRCLARVYHGHKHCPECGSELSVAAIEPAAAPRPCPGCEQPLGARRVGDVVIDECEACHGLFLDQIAIKRIITDRQQVRAEALLGTLPRVEHQPHQRAKLYIKCPICKVVMNRKLFASGSGLVVDVCRAHGTYFDAGELPRLIEFVMNGGLEQAKKKDLERMRESVRRERERAQAAAAMPAPSSGAFQLGGRSSGAGDAAEALFGFLFSMFD